MLKFACAGLLNKVMVMVVVVVRTLKTTQWDTAPTHWRIYDKYIICIIGI